MTTAEGAYRCGECKSWRHLTAWAAAVVEGPLDATGHLIEYTDVEDCYLHEDSIQCTKHPDALIEMFRKGYWCRWWSCPKCRGYGRVGSQGPCREGGYQCSGGLKHAEGSWYWDGKIHEGWLPASEVDALCASSPSLPSLTAAPAPSAVPPGRVPPRTTAAAPGPRREARQRRNRAPLPAASSPPGRLPIRHHGGTLSRPGTARRAGHGTPPAVACSTPLLPVPRGRPPTGLWGPPPPLPRSLLPARRLRRGG